jgi:hypothetical protein
MDLVRQIMLEIEKSHEANGIGMGRVAIDGRSLEEVAYHIMLLNEAGLIEATDCSNSRDGLDWLPNRLTWEGHEFLDNARKDTLWERAKQLAKEKAGTLSFEVLKAILPKLAVAAVTSSPL